MGLEIPIPEVELRRGVRVITRATVRIIDVALSPAEPTTLTVVGNFLDVVDCSTSLDKVFISINDGDFVRIDKATPIRMNIEKVALKCSEEATIRLFVGVGDVFKLPYIPALDRIAESLDSVRTSVESVKTSVDSMKESVDSIKQSVDSVKLSVDSMKQSVDNVKQSVDSVKTSVDQVSTAVVSIDASTAEVKGLVSDIKGSVEGIKSTVEGVKSSVDGVKASVDSVKQSVDSVKSSIDSVNSTLAPSLLASMFNQSVTAMTNVFPSSISIDSPCVVRIYACFSASGRLFLVRTRGGTTITEILNSNNPLASSCAYIFDVMAEGGDQLNLMYEVNATALRILLFKVMVA